MSSRLPDRSGAKRSRSRSPSSWRQPQKFPRRYDEGDRRQSSQGQPRNIKDQVRLNQLQENEQAREWVAQEDIFVLKQAKKKAEIRVKEGRAKPIDWLAVTLRVIDPTRDPLDDEIADSDIDLIDPDGVFEGLSQTQLGDLEKDIDTFLHLEQNGQNRDFWKVRMSSFTMVYTLVYKTNFFSSLDHENYLSRSPKDHRTPRTYPQLCRS